MKRPGSTHARCKLLRAGALTVLFFSNAAVMATTLLIVRPATDTLELVDPGSGLRLASIAVGHGPRRIGVSPDGKRAAVANCGGLHATASGPMTLSIVDLDRPRELRRTSALPITECPVAVVWLTPERIVMTAKEKQASLAVEAATGESRGMPSQAEQDAAAMLQRNRPQPDATTLAVQQFVAGGGDPADLAITSVQPRATCHACAPEP